MNYEIFVNGQSINKVVVNSNNADTAIEVYKQFNSCYGKITTELIFCNIPRMFINCVMDKASIYVENSNN